MKEKNRKEAGWHNDKMMWIWHVMVEFEALEAVKSRIYTGENENRIHFFICWRHGEKEG